MARINPTPAPNVPGSVPTWAAASAGGDTLRAGSGILLVRNGGGAGITVSIPLPGTTRFGQALPDPTALSIAAGAIGVIGPFESDLADPADNLVDVTYSAVTSVTVLLLEA
jgi:hypothetical protein